MGWVTDCLAESKVQLAGSKTVTHFCSYCEKRVDLSSEYQKETHEKGRRHKHRVQMHEMGILNFSL
jgi:hypothetical protein